MSRLRLSASVNGNTKVLRGMTVCQALGFLLSWMACCVASAQQATTDAAGDMREQYVPVEEMDAVFSRDGRGVLLKRTEFQDLLDKARANVSADQPPVAVLVESAQLTVTPAGTQALVKMDLKVRQYVDSWQVIRIPAGTLSVERAEINGQPALIGRDPQDAGVLLLVHQQVGEFTVNLAMSTPLVAVGSDRTAAFPLPQTAATHLSVQCPAGQQLVVNDRQLERPAALDAAADYQIPVGNAADVRLRWNVQQRETESQTLVFVQTDAQLEYRRETLQWSGSSRVSVFGGTINRLVARVPSRFEVVNVESVGLESWTLEGDPEFPGKTRVTLTWRQPFSGDRVVQLAGVTVTNGGQDAAAAEGETAAAATMNGAEQVPALEFVNVTAHSGRLLVRHEEGLRLVAEVQGGIRPVSALDSGLSVEASVFDFWQQQYELTISVRPRDRELFAEVSADIEIGEESVRSRTQFVIEALNAPLFELVFTLPEDWQLLAVRAGEQSLPWKSGSQASTVIVRPATPIQPGELASLSVELQRTIADPETEQVIKLPVISGAGLTVVGGTWRLRAADDLIVTPLSIAGLTPIAGNGVEQMFRNEGTGVRGELSIVRKPARLTGRSVLRTWADSRQQTVDAELTIDLLSGTVRTVVMELSESLGTDVHFSVQSVGTVAGLQEQRGVQPVQIVEQTLGPVVNGLRPVTLKLDRRFAGALTLRARIRQPRTEGAPIAAPVVQVANAIRQHGVLVFEANPEQSLSADITGNSGVQLTDAGLVSPPATDSGRRIALIYRFVQPGYGFQVLETRYATASVPAAICEELVNVCTLNAEGDVQRNTRATLQTSGVQTLRFRLPESEGTYLWSTVLDGAAIEVRRDGEDYLVALPAGGDSSRHTLSVFFETGSILTGTFADQQQVPLVLLMDAGDQKAIPIEVMKQTWQVHYSAETLLVDHDGPYRSISGIDTVGWLISRGRIQWPEADFLWRRVLPTAVVFLSLFVFSALIVRRRWKTLALLTVLFGASGFVFVAALALTRSVMPTSQMAADFSAGTAVPMMAGDGGWEEQMPPARGAVLYDSPPLAETDGLMGGLGGMGGGMGPGGLPGGGGLGAEPMSAAPLAAADPAPATAAVPELLADAPQETQEQVQLGSEVRPESMLGRLEDRSGSVDEKAVMERYQVNGVGGQSGGSGEMLTDPAALGLMARGKRSGTARLSVNMTLEIPENYRMQEFVSLADTVHRPSVLSLALRSREQLTVIRVLAAIATLIVLWGLRRRSLIGRMAVSGILFLLALAVVPLISNAWQSLPDGIACGAVAGMFFAVTGSLWTCCCGPYCPLTWIMNCCGLRQKLFGTASCLLLLIASGTDVFAQDNPANSPAASGSQTAGKDQVVQPSVIIPYEADEPVLRAERVFIRHDDFLRLYRQAWPDAFPDRDVNPLGSSVVSAWFRTTGLKQASGTKHVLSFEARFVVWCDAEQTVSVPLPLGPVGIRSIQVDGAAGAVTPLIAGVSVGQMPDFSGQQIAGGAGQVAANSAVSVGGSEAAAYAVQVSGRGPHVVDVSFDLTAEVEGELGRCDLPLRSPPAGTLEWTLPADGLDARVNGRTNMYRRDGRTVILPIALSGTLRLQWLPQQQATAGDRNFHSTVVSTLAVQSTGMTLRTAVEAEVRQGEVSELEISIPDGFSVQSVTGDDLAGWAVQNTDTTRMVALQFRRAVTDRTSVIFQLFAPLPAAESLASYPVPVSVVKGSSRDTGTVVLRTGAEFQVRSDALAGVTQVNPDEAPNPPGELLPGRPLLAWRYTRQPASIAVRISPAVDEQTAQVLHAVRLEEQRQLWTSRMTLQVRGAPRSRLDLRIPKSFLPLNVEATALKDWYLEEDEDPNSQQRTLSLQLIDARTGTLQIVLQGQTDRDADRQQLTLRPPILKGSQTATGELAVWLDAASESAGVEPGSNWAVRPAVSGVGAFREIAPTAPALYFVSSAAEPGEVLVRLRPAVSTLIGETVTVSSVTETSLDMLLAIRWQIARAAADQFAIEIPEALARAMVFDVPGQRKQLREVQSNGRVRVIFQLQQPVSGQYFVLGSTSLPLPADRRIQMEVPQLIVPDGAPSTLSSQSHYSVIVNQSDALLKAEVEQPDDVVGSDQITTQIPASLLEQAVLISRLRPESSAWQIVSPEQQKVAPAIASLVTHTTVLSEDGSWRSRHQVQVSNESRQFLPVILPAGSRLLYCRVAGTPSRIVQVGTGDQMRHLIPIPQSGAQAAGFEVDFAIAGRFEDSAANLRNRWLAEKLTVPVPVFPEFREDAESGISIARNRWSVYVPESWQARLITDPERTNVVPVTEAEMSDAAVLSEIDQALGYFSRDMAASGGFGFSERSRGSDQAYDTLARLQTLKGNSVEVEQQRGDVLSRLNSLVQQPVQSFQQETQGNLFLYSKDQVQNRREQGTRDQFFADNGLRFGTEGMTGGPATNWSWYGQPEQAGPSEQRFYFGLNWTDESLERTLDQQVRKQDSESGVQDLAKAGQPAPADKAMAGKQQNMDVDASGDATRGRSAGRALLRRRLSETEQEAIPEKAKQDLAEAKQEAPAPAVGGEMADPFGMPAQPQNAAEPLATVDDFAVVNTPQMVEPTGVLSLTFEIPTDGRRLDFLRTGGNPALSLQIWSAESVDGGLGLVWAGVCGLGMLILGSAARKGSLLVFLIRSSLLVTAGGLLCLLLQDNVLQTMGWLLSLVAAAILALAVIVRSWVGERW